MYLGGKHHWVPLPACRRLLFPLLHAEKGRASKEIGDVYTQAMGAPAFSFLLDSRESFRRETIFNAQPYSFEFRFTKTVDA